MRPRAIPKFKSDRAAAAFWDRHASTSYLADLREVTVRILPALRKRALRRAKAQQGLRPRSGDAVAPTDAVTVRLAPEKLAAVRTVADRKSVRCEDLIGRWITAGLKREQAGTV